MTLKDRIKRYLDCKHLSIREFERMCDLGNGVISRLSPTTTPSTLNKIESASDLNVHWLLTGEGEMLKSDCQDSAEDELADNPFIIPLIPAMAMAGALPDISQSVFREQCKRVQAPVAGCDFAIQVSGDSMLPDFKSGDYLAVSKINDSRMLPFSVPVLLDTSEGALLKCLEPRDADTLMAVSLNKAFSPYPIPKDIILGVYRIRAVFRIINTL